MTVLAIIVASVLAVALLYALAVRHAPVIEPDPAAFNPVYDPRSVKNGDDIFWDVPDGEWEHE